MEASTESDRTVREQVLEAAGGLAEELREGGWEVRVVSAGHVTPVPPRESKDDYGLVYIVPDSLGDELSALVDRGSFDRYESFRRVTGTDLSLVTQFTDRANELAVILVGTVDLDRAGPLASAARERGELYSHVRLLDGTLLATFQHENPAHFFPEEL
ncbi:hypothetical protein ACFQH2_05160 [Natronoarchaeum sp. GCM10025703]|uniref:DUF7529 family protein n=1 Tax=unclassified Natronoarchaeum TaxID=2620183 RepID=UPI003617F244